MNLELIIMQLTGLKTLLRSPQDMAYPVYFGCPEKFTDEASVLDVFKET